MRLSLKARLHAWGKMFVGRTDWLSDFLQLSKSSRNLLANRTRPINILMHERKLTLNLLCIYILQIYFINHADWLLSRTF